MTTKYVTLDFFQLQKLIAENKPLQPIYLMFGEESYLQNIILGDFKDRFQKDNCYVNYETFYGESIDFSRLANSLNTLPLGAEKQCIIVKQVDKIKTSSAYKMDSLINDLSYKDDNLIVLLFSLNKQIPTNISLNKIKQYGVIVSFQKPKLFQTKQWVNLKCRENNKEMSPEAIYYLQRLTDNNLGQINNEIEKLFCYLGEDSSRINKEDVINNFYGAVAGNIFDFVDAIGEKKTQLALSLLKKLEESEYHVLPLLAMISRQIKLILQAKRYHNDQKIIKGELHLPSFVINKLINQSQKYHLDELKSAFRYLLEAEIKLKTGYFDPVIVLEQLVIKITG
jgi:DNA polymerase III subunit delta